VNPPAKEFSDADSTAAHIQRVASLADSLKKAGAAIYEHHWDCLCFGSWTITAGGRKDCFEFSWDGREFFLSVSHSHDISGSPHTWRPVENHRLSPDDGKDPLTFVDEFFRARKSG
jgi:hypothetical protein